MNIVQPNDDNITTKSPSHQGTQSINFRSYEVQGKFGELGRANPALTPPCPTNCVSPKFFILDAE